MNDLPRQKLCEIIADRKAITAKTDRDVLDDPRLCRALLLDLCGGHKREISVLVAALEERVAADLRAPQLGVPPELLLARLAKRLVDNRALTEDAARWAVESWALALGVAAPERAAKVSKPDRRPEPITEVSKPPVDCRPEPAQRTFTSNQRLSVLGRPKYSTGEDEWERLGTTPGTITIPAGYSLGIKFPSRANDDELAVLVKELGDSGPIQMLDLSFSLITNAGLAHLKTLTSLTDLNLWYCNQITDVGLAHLRALTNLTDLNLWYCNQITDVGLAHLRALTNLTSLILGSTKITDAGLAHLKSPFNLTSLNLGSCKQITNAGLAHLTSLTNLTDLKIWGCDQITDAGIAKIKRPGLNIWLIDRQMGARAV